MSSIPVLLLKTRSNPDDAYEDYFTSDKEPSLESKASPIPQYQPYFIPVLEHKQNDEALNQLGDMLKKETLKNKYGGMIFTSQRAVEAWAAIVAKVDQQNDQEHNEMFSTSASNRTDAFADMNSLLPFPIYSVGPATSRALKSLLSDSASRPNSPFARLNATILGEESGNGANLAKYILEHYNTLQAQKYFAYFEAPRLPFIPLLGMSSENYGRKRLDTGDHRLQKKPLLFLVGEKRRDVIPKTLMMDPPLTDRKRIEVDEVEVYSTTIISSFRQDFEALTKSLREGQKRKGDFHVQVIVVFSPQGSGEMLQSVGILDEHNKLIGDISKRESEQAGDVRYVIATIGPTTRDYLKNTFEFEPDICAEKPSPEGVGKEIDAFLRKKAIFAP